MEVLCDNWIVNSDLSFVVTPEFLAVMSCCVRMLESIRYQLPYPGSQVDS
jgi:hypothetical protein